MCDNDQSDSGFQDLEIKVTVGSPAGSRSLLVAPSGPPTLSLLLKCTGRDFSKQQQHTPKASTFFFWGGEMPSGGSNKLTYLTEPGAGIKRPFDVDHYHLITLSEHKP